MHLSIILINNQLDAQFFSVYVYFDTLHVSSNRVLIIRRINCTNMASGICHSMQVWMERFSIHTCIPDGHLHRVTCARCGIGKIDSPDDEHIVCSKHVEYRSKHIQKRIVHQVGYLQELIRCNFHCWKDTISWHEILLNTQRSLFCLEVFFCNAYVIK